MTPEEKTKHQENVKAVIDLLQTLHDGLDSGTDNAEPECLCSYCGLVFETKAIAIEHVSMCEKNPLVAKIERLRKILSRIANDKGGDCWVTFAFNPQKAARNVLEEA